MRDRLTSSYFYRGISYTLIFLLAFPAFANSIQFRLKQKIEIREERDGVLEKIQVLPQGTVVEIPKELVPEEFHGEKRDEMALLRWLRTAGGGPNLDKFRSGNRIKRDYFAPVRVVSSPHDKSMEGKVGEVAIRHLARNGGLELVATEDADFVPVGATAEEARRYLERKQAEIEALEKRLEAARAARLEESRAAEKEGPRISGANSTADLRIQLARMGDARKFVCAHLHKSDALTTLENELGPVLARVSASHKRRIEKSFGKPDGVMANVERTCKVDNFLAELITSSKAKLVPPELMFPMMHGESSGSCDAVNYEQNGSISVGLFQINTNSSKFSFCGASYPNRFKDPKCLENPETNLNEALRIMRAKYKMVNGQDPPRLKPWDEMSPRERDYWRKALAAYNGGQGYVYQAYHDIKSFNAKFGTDLDPHDWRNRRLFFFRMALEENGAKYFSNRYKYKRSVANAISNVTHTETILGTEPLTSSSYQGPGLIDRWKEYLTRESAL